MASPLMVESESATSQGAQAKAGARLPRRVLVLLGLLAAVIALLPISRRVLLHPTPPPPPPSAGTEAQARYLLARIKAYPDDAAAYFGLAQIDEQHGYYMKALDRLDAARALGLPEDRTALLRGRCLLQLARHEEARVELEKAARAHPNNVDAAVSLAMLYRTLEREKDAARVLRFFVRHHPSLLTPSTPAPPEALEKLAVAFADVNEPTMALALARQVIRKAPGAPGGHVVAGKSLLVLNRPQEALVPLQRAVELAPNVAPLRYLYGTALSLVPGQRDGALKQWQRTIALDNRFGKAYFQLGQEYARRGDWRRAATGYMLASERGAHGAEALRRAAEMYARLKYSAAATLYGARAAAASGDNEAALRKYLTLARNPDPAWRRQGIDGAAEIYHKLRQYRLYIAFVQKMATGGTVEDLMRVADAYGDLKEFGKRAFYLKKALAKDPTVAAHVHHELGVTAEVRGAHDEAERLYEQAAAEAPGEARHHSTLARIYLTRQNQKDRLSRAIQAARRAVELSPQEGEAYHQLGVAYKAAGNLPQAVQTLQHAIDLQPGYGPSYLQLGQVYKQLGDRTRADEMLKLYRKYEAFDLEKQRLSTQAKTRRDDPAAAIMLAEFFVRARDYLNASIYYERVMRLTPGDAASRRRLAYLYRILDRNEDAQEQERLARRIAPDREERQP